MVRRDDEVRSKAKPGSEIPLWDPASFTRGFVSRLLPNDVMSSPIMTVFVRARSLMPGLVFRIGTYSLKDALRREMKVFFFFEMTGTIECLGCAFTMHERVGGTGCQ